MSADPPQSDLVTQLLRSPEGRATIEAAVRWPPPL